MNDPQPLTDRRARRAASRLLDAIDGVLSAAREMEAARDAFSKAVRADDTLCLVRPDEGEEAVGAR
jgi:hypothetical protein